MFFYITETVEFFSGNCSFLLTDGLHSRLVLAQLNSKQENRLLGNSAEVHHYCDKKITEQCQTKMTGDIENKLCSLVTCMTSAVLATTMKVACSKATVVSI